MLASSQHVQLRARNAKLTRSLGLVTLDFSHHPFNGATLDDLEIRAVNHHRLRRPEREVLGSMRPFRR